VAASGDLDEGAQAVWKHLKVIRGCFITFYNWSLFGKILQTFFFPSVSVLRIKKLYQTSHQHE
jgi:hypothetical protein